MHSGNTSWKSLFASATPAMPRVSRLEVVVFKRSGEPLLVVPQGAPALAAALDLYPAQTFKARLARTVWRLAIRCRLRLAADRDSLLLDPEDSFLQFLQRAARGAGADPATNLPLFALLAGNPRAPGRRFLLLVFSPDAKPIAVVKAGSQPVANELIAKETSFLAGVPAGLPGIPALQERFQHGSISAFALGFVPGDSPRPHQAAGVEPLLRAWLTAGHRRAVNELAAWRRLGQASASDSLFNRLVKDLANMPVQAAIFHGDLAPWNIKVSPADGTWTVLDWERGELSGPPAWDWFHFVLQPAMLVQRQNAAALAGIAQTLLDSPPFRAYAQAAGLGGHERKWLLAYLLHCRDVLRPAEGSPRLVELLSLLSQRWMND